MNKKASILLGLLLCLVAEPASAEQAVRPPGRRVAYAKAPPAAPVTTVRHGTLKTASYWNVGLGLGAGFNYLFPALHLQRRISDRMALGIKPFFSRGSASGTNVNSTGVFLTSSYFINRKPFLGLLVEGAVAYYDISAESAIDKAKGSSLAVSATVGWRAKSDYGFNVYFGAGAQYVKRLSGDPAKINFSGIKPLFTGEIGINF